MGILPYVAPIVGAGIGVVTNDVNNFERTLWLLLLSPTTRVIPFPRRRNSDLSLTRSAVDCAISKDYQLKISEGC